MPDRERLLGGLEMLDGAMLVWFVLTALAVAFVIWDSLTNGVTSWVQRMAWILVTFYAGPVGVFFYLIGCRRPFAGGHDAYTKAAWKQGLNSEMHCLAGDATGIVIAAAIVPAFALGNGWDALLEYLAGFACGLFIFQALMMVRMYDGNYWMAVRKTFFAETVSMNFVMAGMIPVMVVLAAAWTGSDDPLMPAFWFRMSVASVAGGVLAYPINYWLVKNHLKHGCMTLPGADGPAPDLGYCSPEGHRHHGAAMAASRMTGGMEGMEDMEDMADMGDEHMEMNDLPMIRKCLWIGFSFLLLIAALWLTTRWVPIRFS